MRLAHLKQTDMCNVLNRMGESRAGAKSPRSVDGHCQSCCNHYRASPRYSVHLLENCGRHVRGDCHEYPRIELHRSLVCHICFIADDEKEVWGNSFASASRQAWS